MMRGTIGTCYTRYCACSAHAHDASIVGTTCCSVAST